MKKLFKLIKSTFLVITAILILFIAIHQILTGIEKKKHPTIGQYVTVNEKKMNLCVLGEGKNTIVLLPGLGTAAPVLDFMPLAEELSKENKVVIVEPFGYGWSDITASGRLSSIGVMRLVALLAPDNFISDNSKHIYTEENLTMQKSIASWKASNRNVIDEMNHISDSIAKTHDMTFPDTLPVLLFSSDDSDLPPREDGKTSVSFKETYITNPDLQKVVPLDSPHYLHWTCKNEISSYVNVFLNENY